MQMHRVSPPNVLIFAIALMLGAPLFGADATTTPSAPKDRGFTGPDVPPLQLMLGDYANPGVRTLGKRTDIPKLLTTLKEMHTRDYMHLVWKEKSYPGAWQDFQLMAPEFQKAGIRLWLYLTPPSEGSSEPFGGDYVRWALECAKLAKEYPTIAGVCIDDFNGAVKTFTPAYCREMMDAAHKTAPWLALLVVNYYGSSAVMAAHYAQGAIDGVIYPYYFPHRNHSDTTQLMPQIEALRSRLDAQTKKGGWTRQMPLIVMVYATRMSTSPDRPTPEYIQTCLRLGEEASKKGLAQGVVTYCLPKDQPAFVEAVAEVYKSVP